MIISKIDKAKQACKEATIRVMNVLATRRGSAEARAELAQLRESALYSNVCSYCGKDMYAQMGVSPRHREACQACGKTIDSMLNLKSKVIMGDAEAARQLLKGYDVFIERVPYSLRGVNGDVEEVKAALRFVDVAAANYRLESKAARDRETLFQVMQRDKQDIRDMLIQCGMTEGTEELEQRVEEIYAERHI